MKKTENFNRMKIGLFLIKNKSNYSLKVVVKTERLAAL